MTGLCTRSIVLPTLALKKRTRRHSETRSRSNVKGVTQLDTKFKMPSGKWNACDCEGCITISYHLPFMTAVRYVLYLLLFLMCLT